MTFFLINIVACKTQEQREEDTFMSLSEGQMVICELCLVIEAMIELTKKIATLLL